MTPLSHAITELRLAVDRAYGRGTALLLRNEEGPAVTQSQLQDHRTEITGDLCDALDRIQPGLGSTLLAAMYPLCVEFGDGEQVTPRG